MGLGDRVKAAREPRGWSQRALAEAITSAGFPISQGGIDKIEKRNSTRPRCWPELSKVLGLGEVAIDSPEDRPPAVGIDPLLVEAWRRLGPKQRKQLVQFALIMAGDGG